MNVHFHDKPVTTNTIYSDKPYIEDGYTCAKLFDGTKSLDEYGFKNR